MFKSSLLLAFFVVLAILSLQASGASSEESHVVCETKMEKFMLAQCGGACSTNDWQETVQTACTESLTTDQLINACCPELH